MNHFYLKFLFFQLLLSLFIEAKEIEFKPLYFQYQHLQKEFYSDFKRITHQIKQNSSLEVKVVGYTSFEIAADKIAQSYADEIKNLLIKNGVSASRISAHAAPYNKNFQNSPEREDYVLITLHTPNFHDSDNDGVLSNIDKCPKTPANTEVDENGCKVETIIVLRESNKKSSILVSNSIASVVIDKADHYVTLSEKSPPSPVKKMDKAKMTTLFHDIIELEKTLEKPLSFTLYFNGLSLTTESLVSFKKLLGQLSSFKKPYIKIIGHTDTLGDEKRNRVLGLKRATMIKDMIQAVSTNFSTIDVDSYSEFDLSVQTPNNTEEAKNRRVEIFLH